MTRPKIKPTVLILPVLINTVIFILLSMLHFYWALGGRAWYKNVLPTSSNGRNSMKPTTLSTISIAVGLLLLAFVTTGNLGLYDKYLRRKYFRRGNLIIAILFLLRAIGDFKFVGFFKTVKGTAFGINDTQIFSPLCLFVSVLAGIIFFATRANKEQKVRMIG